MSASCSERSGDHSGNSGFVLIAVLWLAGLISVMASVFAVSLRIHVLEESNALGNARAMAEADGLVRLISYRLAGGRLAPGMTMDGTPVYCSLGGKRLARISIQDQAGLVDLNTASPDLLRRVLEGSGLPAERARSLADRIVDFRDPDSQAEADGAELPDYYSAGWRIGPKNAAFSAVDELDQVLGAQAELPASVRALLTVQSMLPGIDPQSAPAELRVWLALDGPSLGSETETLASPRKSFAISATVFGGPHDAVFARRAVVQLTRQPARPFAVLEWRQDRTTGPLASDAKPPGPC